MHSPVAAFALGKLNGWNWHDSHFVRMHTFSYACCCPPLVVCYSSVRTFLSQRSNTFLEILASFDLPLPVRCEPAFPRLPEHVTTQIIGNANASAVTCTITIGAFCLCYLKGSHAAPPFVCLSQNEAVRNRAGSPPRPQIPAPPRPP